MMGYYGWIGAFGGVGMLIGMLVWLAVTVLLVWGISGVFARRQAENQTETLEILKRRYAAAEITAEEFDSARQAIAP
jgi:uncharacterized membrane protein